MLPRRARRDSASRWSSAAAPAPPCQCLAYSPSARVRRHTPARPPWGATPRPGRGSSSRCGEDFESVGGIGWVGDEGGKGAVGSGVGGGGPGARACYSNTHPLFSREHPSAFLERAPIRFSQESRLHTGSGRSACEGAARQRRGRRGRFSSPWRVRFTGSITLALVCACLIGDWRDRGIAPASVVPNAVKKLVHLVQIQ